MPTRDTAWPDGTPCWVDYNAADLDGARTFYADLLGWSYTGGDPQYGGYLSCLSDGRQAAGMMPRMEESQPPAWTTYFAASDAAGTSQKIEEAGGTLIAPPMQVGDMGTMVIALDPQGHAFGLWQAGTHTGVEVYNQPGSLVWNEAAVPDPAAARDFYSAVFGFSFEGLEGFGGYATFSAGGRPLGGLGGPDTGVSPGWTTCFSVADTDAAVATAVAGGATTTKEPETMAYGRYAALTDPWGAPFTVMTG